MFVPAHEMADKEFYRNLMNYIQNIYIRDIWPSDKLLTDQGFLESYIDGKYGDGVFEEYKQGKIDINDNYLAKMQRVIEIKYKK